MTGRTIVPARCDAPAWWVSPTNGYAMCKAHAAHGFPMQRCGNGVKCDYPMDGLRAARLLGLCPACIGSIGGAHGGPDAPYRPALAGEPCGAADCQGADDGERPHAGDCASRRPFGECTCGVAADDGPEDPALDIDEPDGRTMRERIGGES